MTIGAIHWALSAPSLLCQALLNLMLHIRRETTRPRVHGTAPVCGIVPALSSDAADKATEALKGPEGLNSVPDLHTHSKALKPLPSTASSGGVWIRRGFPGSSRVKNPPANARDAKDVSSIPRSGRSPGGGNGNPLQYSCLENSKDRGA